MQYTEIYSRTWPGSLLYIQLKRIENSVKHLRCLRSYFHKKLHLRFFTGLCIRLCSVNYKNKQAMGHGKDNPQSSFKKSYVSLLKTLESSSNNLDNRIKRLTRFFS